MGRRMYDHPVLDTSVVVDDLEVTSHKISTGRWADLMEMNHLLLSAFEVESAGGAESSTLTSVTNLAKEVNYQLSTSGLAIDLILGPSHRGAKEVSKHDEIAQKSGAHGCDSVLHYSVHARSATEEQKPIVQGRNHDGLECVVWELRKRDLNEIVEGNGVFDK